PRGRPSTSLPVSLLNAAPRLNKVWYNCAMMRKLFLASMFLSLGIVAILGAQRPQFAKFVPVTQEMLTNPSPDDWLMFSRTYDAQRFSPLKQITTENVAQLRVAWSRGLPSGQLETIPLVYKGVMYVITPAPSIQAL